MGVFHFFLNCANATKSRKAPHTHRDFMDLFEELSLKLAD